MFLLRYRDPVRYGAWVDTCRAERAPDGAAIALADAAAALAAAGNEATDRPSPVQPIAPTPRYISRHEQAAAAQSAEAEREAAKRKGDRATSEETDAAILKALAAIDRRKRDAAANVACGSSTSAAIQRPGDPSRRSVDGSDPPP